MNAPRPVSARITTSEPAWKAHTSQWQRERSRGQIVPLRPEQRLRDAVLSALLWIGGVVMLLVVGGMFG